MKRLLSLLISLSIILSSVVTLAADGDTTERIQGSDRYQTAVNLSAEYFEEVETVVLASGQTFPDALVGGVLAAYEQAPLLLVKDNEIPASTLAEIERLGAKKAYILGGEKTIKPNVIENLENQGIESTRLAGANRYETSKLIAEEIQKNYQIDPSKVFYADGRDFPDALAAVPYVVANDGVLLLNDGSRFTEGIAIGGEASLPGDVERISGANRYETALKLAEKTDNDKVILVDGTNYPDALAASVIGAIQGADILLTNPEKLTDGVKEELNNYEEVLIVGGKKSVSLPVENTVKEALANESKQEDIKEDNETDLEKEIKDEEEIVDTDITNGEGERNEDKVITDTLKPSAKPDPKPDTKETESPAKPKPIDPGTTSEAEVEKPGSQNDPIVSDPGTQVEPVGPGTDPKPSVETFYNITVTRGRAQVNSKDTSQAKAGDKVTLIANTPSQGQVFDRWTIEGITLQNITSNTITFTMPANSVAATAVFKDIETSPTDQNIIEDPVNDGAGVQDQQTSKPESETVEATVKAPVETKKAIDTTDAVQLTDQQVAIKKFESVINNTNALAGEAVKRDFLVNKSYSQVDLDNFANNLHSELINDNSDSFIYYNGLGLSTLTSTYGNEVQTVITATLNSPKAGADEAKTDAEVTKIVKEITASAATDEEKVKAIHDYIVKKSAYIYGSNPLKDDSVNRQNISVYLPESILFGEGGVCEAYAKLFFLMAKEANLEVSYVTGDVRKSDGSTEGHAWNMVKVGGSWYHIDTTHDDPLIDSTKAKYYDALLLYDYYLVSTENIKTNRTIDNEASLPSSSSDYTHNYRDEAKWKAEYPVYSVNNSTSPDISAIANLIKENPGKEVIIDGRFTPEESTQLANELSSALKTAIYYSTLQGSGDNLGPVIVSTSKLR